MHLLNNLKLSLNPSEDEPCTGKQSPSAFILSSSFMTQVLERENLMRALKQVKRNKGAPGIDSMTIDDLSGYLKYH